MLETPFLNDVFSIVWIAFKNLYPDKHCVCYWETDIRESEDGRKPYGLTDFGDDGIVSVFVSADLRIQDAAEILAHELAHVAVGCDADHGPEWENAFDAIHAEYNRICADVVEGGAAPAESK